MAASPHERAASLLSPARVLDPGTRPPRRWLFDYTQAAVVALIFALFVRTYLFQVFKIPSASMEDTLLVGDHLVVNKFSLAPLALTGERSILPLAEPKRGDIVIFRYPHDPRQDYIKRVIGLPGETLEVRDRQVYIDGKPLEEKYKIHRNPKGLNFDQDDYPPTRIPENSLFCMGDNRDNSKDSRSWGFVPRDYVKGRAFMIWWSYDEDLGAWQKTALADKASGIWDKITHFFTKSRWERSFQIIK